MATAVTPRRRRVVAAAVAAAAVAFLAIMTLTGGRRESQQLVRFQAAGLMAAPPGEIDRVEVERDGRRVTFVRGTGGTWTRDGDGPISAPEAEHLQTSLRFMHVAEPVRVMEPAEWHGTSDAEFGLAPPRYALRLSGRGRELLAARFGAMNPQRVLQYARVEGRDQLYLMPAFVGAEWEQVWERSPGR